MILCQSPEHTLSPRTLPPHPNCKGLTAAPPVLGDTQPRYLGTPMMPRLWSCTT